MANNSSETNGEFIIIRDNEMDGDEANELKDNSERLECAVCLLTCIHPVQLPCNHIFCFLCMKGLANQSKRCAMCRKEIPADYLERPLLVNSEELERTHEFDDGFQWFYEGHNGWWQYDERTSQELEASFKKNETTCELLIAGFLYVIDFGGMIQFRRNDPSRRRRIKRDLANIPKKGIAGLRVVSPTPPTGAEEHRDAAEGDELADDCAPSTSGLSIQSSTSSAASAAVTYIRVKSPSPTPVAPNNTPQTPHTPSADSGTSSPTLPSDYALEDVIRDIESLNFGGIGGGDDPGAGEGGAENESPEDPFWQNATLSGDEEIV